MQTLPEDVIRCVLNNVEEIDVRHVALVSRGLRAIATTHTNFVLPCSIRINNFRDLINSQISLNQLLYVLSSQLPLKLTVSYLEGVGHPDTAWDFVDNHIFSRLPYNMHLLVHLDVEAPASVLRRLQTALPGPAPSLRSLRISSASDITGPKFVELSSNLLKDGAPRLVHVNMGGVSLGRAPVPAFAHVQRLVLWYGRRTPSFNISVHFPVATDIRIHFIPFRHVEGNFALSLHGHSAPVHLRFESGADRLYPSEHERLDIARLPIITWTIGEMPLTYQNCSWAWAGVTSGSIAVHEHFTDRRHVVSVRAENGIQRNIRPQMLVLPEQAGDIALLAVYAEGSLFADRVIDIRLIVSGMQHWPVTPSLALPMLERMQIDVDDSEWDLQVSHAIFKCDRLRELLLVAHSDQTSVRVADVMCLGRILGQDNRQSADRAVLKLYGLSWDSDPTVVEELFSVVQSHPDYDDKFHVGMLDLSDD